MRKLYLIFLLLALTFNLIAEPLDTQSKYNEIKDDINVFYSNTCHICKDIIDYLELVQIQNPEIIINYYEIKEPENKDNHELFLLFSSEFDTGERGVPRMFINGKALVGFSSGECTQEYNDAYRAYVACEGLVELEIAVWAEKRGIEYEFLEGGKVPNLLPVFIVLALLVLYGISFFIFRKQLKNKEIFRFWLSGMMILLIVLIFLLIFLIPETVIMSFAQKLPFPIFVFIIALADGFNPCAFAVLFILLSLLTHADKKRDMNIIGSIFIIVSAVMYFIFIIIIMTVESFVIDTYGTIILQILGAVIFIVGIINFKDYIFFKKGISMSITDKQQKNISKKAAGIVKFLKKGSALGFISAVTATVLLGISVNIIELGCSAILPAVYITALLNLFGTELGAAHVLWTIIYAVLYVIPMIAILFWFIFTFKSKRLSESKGRLLKLIGGIIMITGGLILIIKPGILFFH